MRRSNACVDAREATNSADGQKVPTFLVSISSVDG
jgi:hypothetical protein